MNKNELYTQLGNFDQIYEYIEDQLEQADIDETSKSETLQVFEALYNDMAAKGVPKDTRVIVWKAGHFGSVNISIRFKGQLYVPSSDEEEDITVEQMILSAYGDRIEQRYHAGGIV